MSARFNQAKPRRTDRFRWPAGLSAALVAGVITGFAPAASASPDYGYLTGYQGNATPAIATAMTSQAVITSTTMTTKPCPGTAGQAVALSAAVTAADGSSPAGWVQFEVGGTAVGTPAPVSAGMASTTATFAQPGSFSLSAVFVPADADAYASSAGALLLTVQAAGTTASMQMAVTIAATGTFSVGAPSGGSGGGTVALPPTPAGANATSVMNPITVDDTLNTYPGWSVTGQVQDFTGTGTAAGDTISGNQLGWVPTDTSLAPGAALGPTVLPGQPGLGSTAAVLASAPVGAGLGSSDLAANLTLAIPPSAPAGTYTSTLTLTVVPVTP